MRMATSKKDSGYFTLLPGFHLLMILVMITIPFGELQATLFSGLSPAKVFIPLLFCYCVCVHLYNVKIHPLLLPYVLFVFCTLPSLVTGVGFIGILIALVGYILLFQVLYSYSFSINKIRELINAYIIGLTFVAFLTLLALVTGFDMGAQLGKPFIEYWLGFPIVSGPSNNPNGFASLFVPGVPFAFSCFLSSENKLNKLIYGGVTTILFLTLVLTFSRSGMAAVLLSCFVIHHHKRNITTFSPLLLVKLLSALIGIILLSTIYFIMIELVTGDIAASGVTTDISSNKEMSGGYRTLVLLPMLSIAMENAFIGVGFGNVKGLIEAQTGLYINSHNTPFGIAMDYGLIALVFLLVTIALSCRDYTRALRSTEKDGKKRLLISALFASMGAMIFHGLFHELYIHIMLWFLIIMGPVVLRSVRIA